MFVLTDNPLHSFAFETIFCKLVNALIYNVEKEYFRCNSGEFRYATSLLRKCVKKG